MNVIPHYKKEGTPAAHWLVATGCPNILAKSAAELSLKAIHGTWKLTPLHLALISRNTQVIDTLLDSGKCPLEAKDHKGWTPLHHAALISNELMIRLIKMGAQASAEANDGCTPMDLYRLAHAPETSHNKKIPYQNKGAFSRKSLPTSLKHVPMLPMLTSPTSQLPFSWKSGEK